jgi:hypothetical protein
MKKVLESTTDVPNGRWVVHQLNSFSKESKLIKGVHSHVYLDEDIFRGVCNEISILHFSTCYNAATMLSSEDTNALEIINADSLVLLAGFIAEDLKKLLGQTELIQLNQGEKSFIEICVKACEFVKEVKKIKREIKKQKSDIKKLKGQLQEKQKELTKKLQGFLPAIAEVISRLEGVKTIFSSPNISKALLILRVYNKILV